VIASVPAAWAHVGPYLVELPIWIAFLAASHVLGLPIVPKADVRVSLGAPLSVATAVLLPPPLVVVVNFLGFANEREFQRPFPVVMSLFNRAQIGVSAGAAALVGDQERFGLVVATALAAIVYAVLNTLFVFAAVWMRRRLSLAEALKSSAAPFPRFAVDFALVTLLSLFVVIAYQEASVWAVGLLALPIWLGFSALRSARESEDRAQELAIRVRELETLHGAATEFLSSRQANHAATIAVGALSTALDAVDVQVALDGHTAEHLQQFPVPGAEPAVIGVPGDLEDRSVAVVEAIAGLLGMSLVRQDLEQELAEVQRARAELSAMILEEGTRERSRIALELHDDVLPSLAAAQIQADNARSALAAGALDRADDLAAHARDAVQAAIARLRQVLDDFRRQILVPGRLRDSLVAVLEEMKVQHGIEGKLRSPDPLPPIPFAVEILLMEIVRGCIANVAKHAEAETVEIVLDVSNDKMQLEVLDDGRGFRPDEVPAGHHGLDLMNQRVALARGRFAVLSDIGEGTRVQVEVPV
jgi:signal transduction histidine kinase